MAIATTNPASGELLKSFEPLTPIQIEHKLQLATDAFQSHRRTSFADRARMMLRAADILEKEKDDCAHLMTLEMGKTLRSAVSEAPNRAIGPRFFARKSERFLGEAIVEAGAKRLVICYQT